MCDVVVWSINRAGNTAEFRKITREICGVDPDASVYRPVSDAVRASAHTFTLTRHGCDCDSLVGNGNRPTPAGEVQADEMLRWIRRIFESVPMLRVLTVMRTWDPDSEELPVVAERHLRAYAVQESDLRGLEDQELLLISAS